MRRNFKQLYCWAISRGIHIFLLDGGATRHRERNEKSRGELGRAWRAQSTSVSSFYLLHFPSPFFFSCFHSTKLWIDILPKNISANCTCKQHLILGGSTVEEWFLQSPWWKLTSRKHCYKWYYGHFSLTKRFRNFQLRWKRNTRFLGAFHKKILRNKWRKHLFLLRVLTVSGYWRLYPCRNFEFWGEQQTNGTRVKWNTIFSR